MKRRQKKLKSDPVKYSTPIERVEPGLEEEVLRLHGRVYGNLGCCVIPDEDTTYIRILPVTDAVSQQIDGITPKNWVDIHWDRRRKEWVVHEWEFGKRCPSEGDSSLERAIRIAKKKFSTKTLTCPTEGEIVVFMAYLPTASLYPPDEVFRSWIRAS
jgi:hypothetical protein